MAHSRISCKQYEMAKKDPPRCSGKKRKKAAKKAAKKSRPKLGRYSGPGVSRDDQSKFIIVKEAIAEGNLKLARSVARTMSSKAARKWLRKALG